MREVSITLVLFVACGGSDEPPLTDATSLQCPTPGDLPFRLESHGFQNSTNAGVAIDDPRFKEEASDVVGNPGGPLATVYLADDAAPDATLEIVGKKARTMPSQGLFSTELAGETVSLWFYDTDAAAWNQLARGPTDVDGLYSFALDAAPPNAAPIYAMLEADGSCASHELFLQPSGAKFVVMDIDGTLTSNDGELINQLVDETYVPAMKTAADLLAQTWAAKGYQLVYLTARPHELDIETRGWLDLLGFPAGALITENGGEQADEYKTLWLQRLIQTFGWVPVAAYGNADTDITAYANAGIALDRTFIIGPNAGMGGTVAIPNDDYTAHIADFVTAQPDN